MLWILHADRGHLSTEWMSGDGQSVSDAGGRTNAKWWAFGGGWRIQNKRVRGDVSENGV